MWESMAIKRRNQTIINTNGNVVYVFDYIKAQLHIRKMAAENIRRIRNIKENDGIINAHKIVQDCARKEV